MEFFLIVAILLFSIVVHEVAHAWQARREGDPTADDLGRITLNPIPHLDPMGSVIVPLLLYFSNAGFLFGWAKPVPVDPRNYRDYRAGDIRVSLAGIVSNLVLAALFTVAAGLFTAVSVRVSGDTAVVVGFLRGVTLYGVFINLILAFFNLIPIPPLDGSHVVYHVLPRSLRGRYRELGRYGILILVAIMFLVPDAFSVLLSPVYVVMGWADWFIRLWA